MKVSVVIPHLRGTETLLPLLSDLKREAKDVSLEVILVDNAAQDGSSVKAKELHPWIRKLSLPENRGYAGGCNAGVRVSRGDWIWLLNDDVALDQGVISEMLKIAESADDIAAVQPKIMSLVTPGLFDYAGGAGGLIDRFGYPFAYGRIGAFQEQDEGQYDESREIFWASGTACLWRRETLHQIGLLDSAFFAHMEEIDLAWRAWNSGWRILSAPAGVVHHLGGGTLSYQSWKKMYLNHRNGLITLLKNLPCFHMWWIFPARALMDAGVGTMEAFSGRPQRITAIVAGWVIFLVHIKRWIYRRTVIKSPASGHKQRIRKVMYNGSILWEYFRGVRRVTCLAKVGR